MRGKTDEFLFYIHFYNSISNTPSKSFSWSRKLQNRQI